MNHQLFVESGGNIIMLLHLTSVILLSGVTFAAFAAPHQENRRTFLGFGATGMMALGFPGWAMVKVVCLAGVVRSYRDGVPDDQSDSHAGGRWPVWSSRSRW